MANPELSVVIAAQGSAEQTARCLQSLLGQSNDAADRMELIVAEGPPYLTCAQLESRFPKVKFVHASGTSIPMLHGAGINASSAPLVAITESHCTFPDDWAQSAIVEHRSSPASVIGGSVELGNRSDGFNTALFLCDYAQFVPPISQTETTDLPGNNIVFKRGSLGETGSFAAGGFWKTFHCKELAAQGHKLISVPSLRVSYNRQLTPDEIMVRRYNHGRCFGAMRAANSAPTSRFIVAIVGPSITLLLMCKLAARCWGNRQCRNDLLLTAPWAVACLTMWALGEWIGNLLGAGSSCEQL